MKTIAMAAALLAACAGPASEGHVAKLEARIAKLEAANAQYADALAFLKKVYDQQNAQAERAANEPAADAVFAVEVMHDVDAGQADGPATALVTIVEGFDFACPYCSQLAPSLDELVAEYGGKLRVVYKHMVIHDPAWPAHLAACAAAKQGKFLAFKRAFWTQAFAPYAETRDVDKLGRANILAIAGTLGLDAARLQTDMDSAECKLRVTTDMAELENFHVSATPTMFINGSYIAGAVPKPELKDMIDAKLAAAEKSGVPAVIYYQQEIVGKGEKQFRPAKQ